MGDSLYIAPGNYDSSVIGKIKNIEKINNLLITGKTTQISSISSLS